MRRCGAAARTMLEAAAAERWKVPVSEVEAKNHEVVHRRTGRRAGYGSLAKAAASQRVPARETLRLKDPTKFRYIGKSQVKLVDGRDIATGKAQYGIDTRLDGMLYAVVARPPVYGGKVASFDPAEALKVPGVERVVQIEDSPPPAQFNPLGGVAVLARNTWAAMQGRRALKITWDDGPNAGYDSVAFKASLEESARKPGKVVRNDGDFAAAAAGAARRHEAEYYVPHLAHATMEPPSAAARIANGKCEVWGCFQSPQLARDVVAKRLGMSADDVTVHVTLLGGGCGGDRPRADRLGPSGGEHSPCLCHPVVRRGVGRGGRPRPQGFPPRGDRSGPSDQAADAGRCVEPRRSAGAVPGGHRPAATSGGDGRPQGRLGQEVAQAPRSGHRCPLQLPELHRGGRGSRRRRGK